MVRYWEVMSSSKRNSVTEASFITWRLMGSSSQRGLVIWRPCFKMSLTPPTPAWFSPPYSLLLWVPPGGWRDVACVSRTSRSRADYTGFIYELLSLGYSAGAIESWTKIQSYCLTVIVTVHVHLGWCLRGNNTQTMQLCMTGRRQKNLIM